jgi:hypothetical protein
MKIETTFWSEKKHSFDNLLYIKKSSKSNKCEIVFKANLSDKFDTYKFLKEISDFVISKELRESYHKDEVYYQFGVLDGEEIIPIKWFDLVIDDQNKISHDIAFETTLIWKNDIELNFGRFPMYLKGRYSMYRGLKIKQKVYKYLANQIKNLM